MAGIYGISFKRLTKTGAETHYKTRIHTYITVYLLFGLHYPNNPAYLCGSVSIHVNPMLKQTLILP